MESGESTQLLVPGANGWFARAYWAPTGQRLAVRISGHDKLALFDEDGTLRRQIAFPSDPVPDWLFGDDLLALVNEHFEEMLSHYGTYLGLRNARKLIAWYLGHLGLDDATTKEWRRRLCTADRAADVRSGLGAVFATAPSHRSAA